METWEDGVQWHQLLAEGTQTRSQRGSQRAEGNNGHGLFQHHDDWGGLQALPVDTLSVWAYDDPLLLRIIIIMNWHERTPQCGDGRVAVILNRDFSVTIVMTSILFSKTTNDSHSYVYRLMLDLNTDLTCLEEGRKASCPVHELIRLHHVTYVIATLQL